ncbi:TrlF family AAA-like ATPase [Microbacterium aurantiacum]|uniref:TrlF family AAA-like ATPase n=2 Tax=Microbacterium aurantiacum TaxID=162393 RepID=UPI004035D2AC
MSTTGSSRTIEIADHGGHFYKADFQVHTPRDTQWDGTRPQDEAERKTWAESFVAAARTRGLHAVAISDHHDFAYFPYVKEAAQSETTADGGPVPEKERLVVFPALELSLTVPCQAIMILDAEFPTSRLDDVLKALHFEPIDPALTALPQTQNLDDSGDLNEIHAKLDKHVWLKGRYILLPNVTPSGYRTLMREQFQGKYKEMIPVGGYIDGPFHQFDNKNNVGTKRILDGLVPAWGSKRLAIFQTSDARKADFSTLGTHSTWVKWAVPTAEAIRQACLAQESRVSQSDPALPNVWISRIVVSQSKFMGRADVSLNPQYTALIGGRGTGKSTLLDYLRWALCDQPAEATDDDEVANPRVRQRKLIEATLKPLDAHVEVHCLINGIAHVVRRYAADGSVQLKVGNGEFEKTREANIQSLLPIHAYSQKQLSSVAIRVEELLRFITAPIHRQLEEVARKQQEIAGRLRENYGTLQRYRALAEEVDRSDLRIRSLAEQAQSLRNDLAGLSAADREVLDGKPVHDDARAAAAEIGERLGSTKDELSRISQLLGASIDSLHLPHELPPDLAADGAAYLTAARESLTTARASIVKGVEELEAKLTDTGSIRALKDALIRRLDAFDASYVTVKARSSAHEAKLSELATLEDQQRQARGLLQSQRKELAELGEPLVLHQGYRVELNDVRKERSAALEAQCLDLSSSSDGLIRATLSLAKGFDAALVKFKGLISGSNVRGSRIEDLFDGLSRESDPLHAWELMLAELESLTMLEPDADITSEQTPTLSRLGLPLADQKKIALRLSPDGWLDLSLVELADTPEFEYRAKDAEYIPFASASAGQQASALLATLLAQNGSPLIIDQPEDDLDSDTVQKIVGKIWQSKNRRQLIFSSHNANLVVNGDADLVLVCAYVNVGDQSAGHIKTEGAIDVDAVRSEITAVMEGGEKAFRLRKEKYGF